MSSTSTVYLVTGANRGIGLALVQQLLLKPNTVVFAGVRDPKTAALRQSDRLHVIQVASSDVQGNKEAAEQIRSIAGKLDVVIANAGLYNSPQTALETEPSVMLDHFNVNTIGPLVIFQATYSLLKESTNPRFTVITSGGGSIERGATLPLKMMSYGTSKAAVNYVTRKIHNEHPEIVAFPITPGPVNTDMTAYAKEADPTLFEVGLTFMTPEKSAKAIVKLIENATRKKESGQFMTYAGDRWVW